MRGNAARFTYAQADKLLRYELTTGKLYMRVDARGHPAGTEAGVINSNGYRVVHIQGRREFAHRLAWLLSYKKLPRKGDGHIDHINKNRDDNRLANLRHTTHASNLHNGRTYKNNTTGYRGISQNRKKWSASIWVGGKKVNLGTVATKEEAARLFDVGVKRYRDKHATLNFPSAGGVAKS